MRCGGGADLETYGVVDRRAGRGWGWIRPASRRYGFIDCGASFVRHSAGEPSESSKYCPSEAMTAVTRRTAISATVGRVQCATRLLARRGTGSTIGIEIAEDHKFPEVGPDDEERPWLHSGLYEFERGVARPCC